MTIQEHIDRLDFAARAVAAYAPQVVRRQAQTGKTLLVNRSIEQGISVDGQKQQYSNKPAYRSGFAGAALNAAGRAWAKGMPGTKGTWREFREAQGRESQAVNLFYSGGLWRSLRVFDGPQQAGAVSAYIAPSDQESAAKLLGNLKRYGNFMRHTEAEKARLRSDAGADLTEFFDQALHR